LEENNDNHQATQENKEQDQSKHTGNHKEMKKRLETLDSTKFLKLDSSQKDEEVESNEIMEDAQEDEEFLKIQKQLEVFSKLFSTCKIFLSREVPVSSLEFVIKSFGGPVSWEDSSSFPETDESITHQVVDRNSQKHQYLSRAYVQPQWIYDCVNEKTLLPTSEYGPASTLPPHLSPFVEPREGDYVPLRREKLDQIKQALELGQVLDLDQDSSEEDDESSDDEIIEEKIDEEVDHNNPLEAQYKAELKAEIQGKPYMEKVQPKKRKPEPVPQKTGIARGLIMMTKKNRHLYDRIQAGVKRRRAFNRSLVEKRENLDATEKKKKRKLL